jgi:Mycothiol maleylpyruvate isomerase N-terminal domain
MDATEEWASAQRRVIDLVAGLSAARAQARVPACPGWTVRELSPAWWA